MSLINQMLLDLESRRGERLADGAEVLAGLAPEGLARADAGRSMPRVLLTAAVAAMAAALAWLLLERYAATPAGMVVPAAPLAGMADRAPSEAMLGALLDQSARALVPAVAELDGAPHLATVKPVFEGAGTVPEEPVAAAAPTSAERVTGPEIAVQPALAGSGSENAPVPTASRPAAQEEDALPAPQVEYRGTVRKDNRATLPSPQASLAALMRRLRGGADLVAVRGELAALVEREPGLAAAREALARELLRVDDRAGAERVLRAGLARDPAAARQAELLAHLLVARADVAGALATLAPARRPTEPELEALAAALEQRLGQHAAAVESYRRVLARQPRRGTAWAGLAISLDALGEQADARSAFRRALADPTLSASLRRYAGQVLDRR